MIASCKLSSAGARPHWFAYPLVKIAPVLLIVFALSLAGFAQGRQGVLIKTKKPYTQMVSTITKLGGTVTYQYQYVDGIAAEIPQSARATIEAMVGSNNIAKDEMMYMPQAAFDSRTDPAALKGIEADATIAGEQLPADYSIDNTQTNATVLHALGLTGANEVVAVIDSGFRGGFTHVSPGRVLTGFSLVPGEPDANSPNNFSHGTQVAGQIAANIGFCFGNTAHFAIVAAALGAGNAGAPCPSTAIFIPMVGSAPGALIYPVKVFPNSGAGTPNSRTIAALEHVLSKRLAWNAGDHVNGLNIHVVNMSLGGGTLWAGQVLIDQTVDKLVANDILVVVSAGNDGFSTITTGSPGTSMSALTVGASQDAAHEWIFRSQFSAPCTTAPLASALACALTFRPDRDLQMADFSSRGPTHDGRIKPDVTANGAFNFGMGSGTTSTVNFFSGTSFSAPNVSGIAAVLHAALPNATARQIRNAIIMTARPNLIPTGKARDQGAGFVDAFAAYNLLLGGTVPDTVQLEFPGTTRNVVANIAHANLPVFDGSVNALITGLRPAETAEFAYQIPPNTGSLNVSIHDIAAENPPALQNQFFGDDVFLKIQNTTVHHVDQLEPGAFLFGPGKTYSFANPEAGVFRITPAGDWTNAGNVRFVMDIWTTEQSNPQHTAKAKINQGDVHTYTINVPAGTAALTFNLAWMNMNGNYPINDLDLTITPAGGVANFNCSTGRTPELCSFANPTAGTWTVRVEGFSVNPDGTPGGREMYTLRVAADNRVLSTK
jgi:serine protease AprX